MLRPDKESLVEGLRSDFERSAGVLFLDFTGLTVGEADTFRRRLQRETSGTRYVVVKNTLIKRAMEGKPYAAVADKLPGSPTGVLFGFDEPVTGAKLLFDFLKECQHLKVKAGVVDGRAIRESDAEALSKMPSREELQASIVTLALSPGRKLAAQLKSPAGRVVGAIEALVARLGGDSGAAA
jgi:large subunit ribosomal protein L10